MEPKIRLKGFSGEWETHVIGDISSSSKGSGYSKSDIIKEGTPIILYGRLYTNYSSSIDKIDTFVTPKENSVYSVGGEVIIPGSGETAEDIAIASHVVNSGVILGGDLNVLRFDEEKFDSTYMALAVSNGKTHKELSSYAQGKSVVHLRNTDIAKGHVICPRIDEQKLIAKYIYSIDSLIQSTTKKIESLRQVKAASLQSMFPQEGETTPRVRFKGFEGEWNQCQIKDICRITTGQSNTQDQVKDGQYPFYIRSEKIARSNRYLYDLEAVITIGDGNIGRVFHYVNGKFDLHQRCYMMYDFDSSIFAKYFYCYFSAFFYDRVIRMSAKATVDSVRLDMIAEMNIKFPTFEEQQKIASYFTNLDSQITLQTQRLEKLKQIKSACLDNMFV